jgi:predicted nucleotidyltransferase component of viral defense system
MDKIARRSPQDRSDLFSETASKRGIRPAIAEKDFWVCLVLNLLFVKSPFKQSLVFKGGTSLSKVYRLIERFSEDIDLVLDWQLIGFGEGLKDPMRNFDSKGKQDRFNKQINQLAAAFIKNQLCPKLDELVQREKLGLSAIVDKIDSNVVSILYPAAFSEEYIRPEVRLEIGPLASWVPSATHIIQPYAYEAFPNLFENPHTPVVAITAERTFWEKATILHQEAHRETPIPQRYSRHYYDLYKLAQSSVLDSAFAQIDLLRNVVRFKERFYPSNWARYDLAKPGSFKLLPTNDAQLKHLERDYKDMQIMLFGSPPTFDSIVEVLRQLEAKINALPSPAEVQN